MRSSEEDRQGNFSSIINRDMLIVDSNNEVQIVCSLIILFLGEMLVIFVDRSFVDYVIFFGYAFCVHRSIHIHMRNLIIQIS